MATMWRSATTMLERRKVAQPSVVWMVWVVPDGLGGPDGLGVLVGPGGPHCRGDPVGPTL